MLFTLLQKLKDLQDGGETLRIVIDGGSGVNNKVHKPQLMRTALGKGLVIVVVWSGRAATFSGDYSRVNGGQRGAPRLAISGPLILFIGEL